MAGTGLEQHVRNRFLAELLKACAGDINHKLDIGGGFTMADIMNNLDVAGGITGFSGVYIDVSGTMPSFRAMAAKTKDSPLRFATFAIKKYGLQVAWKKALSARAVFVGYKGHLLDVPHPPVETIKHHCLLKRGQGWIDDKGIDAMLAKASG